MPGPPCPTFFPTSPDLAKSAFREVGKRFLYRETTLDSPLPHFSHMGYDMGYTQARTPTEVP